MNVKGVSFQFGVGGEQKINSSSIILREWQHESEERVWGKFYNLFQDHRLKLKELVVQPNQGMSFQRHHQRSEIWFVSRGSCIVKHSLEGPDNVNETNLSTEDVFHIKQGEWHQLINPFEVSCHIIEIQYRLSLPLTSSITFNLKIFTAYRQRKTGKTRRRGEKPSRCFLLRNCVLARDFSRLSRLLGARDDK